MKTTDILDRAENGVELTPEELNHLVVMKGAAEREQKRNIENGETDLDYLGTNLAMRVRIQQAILKHTKKLPLPTLANTTNARPKKRYDDYILKAGNRAGSPITVLEHDKKAMDWYTNECRCDSDRHAAAMYKEQLEAEEAVRLRRYA